MKNSGHQDNPQICLKWGTVTLITAYIILFVRLEAMMTAEYILELGNVFHSGQVINIYLNLI